MRLDLDRTAVCAHALNDEFVMTTARSGVHCSIVKIHNGRILKASIHLDCIYLAPNCASSYERGISDSFPNRPSNASSRRLSTLSISI